MSTQLDQNKRYLWASEATRGTDAVEAILNDDSEDIVWQQVREMTITPEGTAEAPTRQRGSASGTKHSFIKGRCSVSGEIPLTAYESSSAQTPYYDAILQALNLEPDLATSDESTYTPSTAQQSSATIYQFIRNAEDSNWRLRVVTGFRGSGEINFSTGEEAYLSFEGGGDYFTLTEPAAFIDPATGKIDLQKDGTTSVTARATGTEKIADQTPLMCDGMTITVHGTTYTIGELTMDLGWTVDQIEAMTGTPGKRKHILTRGNGDDRPNGSFSVLDWAQDSDLDALYTAYETSAEGEIKVEVDDGSDKVTMAAPKAQLNIPEQGSNGNLVQYDFPFMVNGDWSELTADNGFSLRYHSA